MHMKKRIFSIALLFVMTVSLLCGCGKEKLYGNIVDSFIKNKPDFLKIIEDSFGIIIQDNQVCQIINE